MKAFWELSSTRDFGMGIGPIPWNHIVDYGSRKGLYPSMIDDVFLPVIRTLDEAYIEDQKKNQK